ncbi:sigma factor-like helix-turn-helix DNA-binding protein [Robertmurraya massiliosenegalensis]|uniref:sigma factor-like helix-turn-helix DNA-binding protein n=1 Tax=Robertmurraya massiliosenegalensis TaxID=1287657 RepID=UPI00031825DF|nr:sigma factor-like helix-turn-helix DNA-binding protein [Robertmurraya massiliosenegalensis]
MPGSKPVYVMNKSQYEENETLKKYYRGLQTYCRFLTKNKWEGDDLAQESLYRAIKQYEVTEINHPLLKKIAFHYWIDTIRRRKLDETELLNEVHEKRNNHPTTIMDTVQKLMEKLTPKQSVIFFLNEAFLYRSKEISDIIKMPETTVKALLYRARKRIEKENTSNTTEDSLMKRDLQNLMDLMVQSLLEEDPNILIKQLPSIPIFIHNKTPISTKVTDSPLNIFSMAA